MTLSTFPDADSGDIGLDLLSGLLGVSCIKNNILYYLEDGRWKIKMEDGR